MKTIISNPSDAADSLDHQDTITTVVVELRDYKHRAPIPYWTTTLAILAAFISRETADMLDLEEAA